ncbi:MAG TPA: trigger factor [Flavobacteriales bacterium]|jgi:trigger factor|nr:trigger factor [Flavobacteriales bacterium]
MNTQHELMDEINGTIKIDLERSDYADKVEQILRDYRKKADMPGFRKGHVPMGMIKKLYGTSVLVNEVNQKLSEEIDKYINENALRVLGSPLPEENQSIELDVNKMGDLSFSYKIGLAPEIEFTASDKIKFTEHKILIDDELIDKYADDIRRRYGKFSEVDEAGENDMLGGEFVEYLGGEEVQGGIRNKSTIALEFLENENLKNQLLGLTKGESIIVDPNEVSKGKDDLMKMLNISTAQVEEISNEFNFTVETIYHAEPAELDQDFFDKLYGKDEVADEAGFREKIREELQKQFAQYEDVMLYRLIKEDLVKKVNPTLPDEFLKEFLAKSNEEMTEDQLETEYPKYAEGVRWNLIEEKIVKDNGLQIQQEELTNYVKEQMRKQFAMYGQPEVGEDLLNSTTQNILANQEEAKKLFEELYFQKMMDFFRSTFKLKEKEVSYDDFVKLATGETPKKGILNTISNLFGQ